MNKLAHYISIMVPNNSPNATSKANNRKWEQKDRDWLRENYHKLGRQACADKLDRTPASVKQQCKLMKVNLRKHWRYVNV